MDQFQWIIASAILTGTGMAFITLTPANIKPAVHFLFVLLLAAVTTVPAVRALQGESPGIVLHGVSFFSNIPLRIDALSAWFMLIVNLTCITGAFYGIGYMKAYEARKPDLTLHWVMFLLFQFSMLWVCMLQHGLAFLIAWELMSIASFLLVLFDHQNKTTLQAALNYLVQTHIGVVLLSVAFIWVYAAEGSFDFQAIGRFFSSRPNHWLFLLFFAGFGIKAGFIPLHSWLPHAHPAAPSHVSGVMSGVIVKLGIYGIIRSAYMLQSDLIWIGECVLALSLMTGIYGILNAAVHRDFKKLLAYCTIENIGVIGIGIGLGLIGAGADLPMLSALGFAGALLHTLNHALFKSLLFYAAGAVYQQAHTRDMEKLGGLAHKMPHTAVFFLAGALAIGGLPPFNGFVSEFLIYKGFLQGIPSIGLLNATFLLLGMAGLALIGGLSMLTFTKSFGTIFLGSPRTLLQHEPAESPLLMRIPQYFILALMLSIGIFPHFYFSAALAAIPSQAADPAALGRITSQMAGMGKYALLFSGLITVALLLRNYMVRRRPATRDATWGCGYVAPTARMQYTGKSFSKTLGKLLGFVVTERKQYEELKPEELFPKTRRHSSHYPDFFEEQLIRRLTSRLLSFLNYFQFIQNGRTQMYLLYGVFFVLLVFLGTLLNVI